MLCNKLLIKRYWYVPNNKSEKIAVSNWDKMYYL